MSDFFHTDSEAPNQPRVFARQIYARRAFIREGARRWRRAPAWWLRAGTFTIHKAPKRINL